MPKTVTSCPSISLLSMDVTRLRASPTTVALEFSLHPPGSSAASVEPSQVSLAKVEFASLRLYCHVHCPGPKQKLYFHPNDSEMLCIKIVLLFFSCAIVPLELKCDYTGLLYTL